MSSDVHISGESNATASGVLLYSPKNISKSLQNLQSELSSDVKAAPSKDSKLTRHRRTQSQSQSLAAAPVARFQRSHSYQPEFNGRNSSSHGKNDSHGDYSALDVAALGYDAHGGVGGLGSRNSEINNNSLVIVSSKIRNISSIRQALLAGVSFVQYNCDTHSLDDLDSQISQSLNGRKVNKVALILSCSGSSLQLMTKEEKMISKDGTLDKAVQEFFIRLVQKHFISADSNSRIDFFAWYGLQFSDVTPPLVAELESLTNVSVGVWRDLSGSGLDQRKTESLSGKSCYGELYFRLDKLRNWSGRHQQSLAGFEKIRTVGKGAYGAAVLYKKKDDESLVILKEINMHDLNASERQLALNEVSVLAMLDHPNIISYYDSFEEDGVLMIEMEYADNGTIAQFLSKQDHPLDERDILMMFQQMVAAIKHIHSHNILHRDLKTDNIFLTKEGVIKIGDFGISKMMGSANKGAQTVLGTPYYISPEMCEGKQYSFKSDIWALGCILYEMACLQKTFEGSNLPALVNKIMKGQFAPVKGNYSEEFKQLVVDMLRKNPEERPEANTIMYQRLPQVMNRCGETKSDLDDDVASSENLSKKAKVRSVLYYFESSTTLLTCINDLPPRMKIKHMAVGPDHVIVTTTERQVFTWGSGQFGQLGHGDTRDRYTPTPVEGLKGKSITLVCCGVGFSVFGSDNGLVLTCGDGRSGCLGHGDWSGTSRPRLIESLLSTDVMSMACGESHVVVISRQGEVLSWGNGSRGQLGLGNEESQCVPTAVQISESTLFKDVQCGVDGTMLVSDVGGVFACGNNENNKLGLNNRQGFLMAMKNIFTKTEVDGKNVPTPVRALARHRVIAVSMGSSHTAVIVEPGHVITFGRNTEGQLGTQNAKPSNAPVEVKALEEKFVNHVFCGDHYTVASTKEHELYYWGLRYFSNPSYEDTTSYSSTNDSTSYFKQSLHKGDLKVESVPPLLSTSNDSTTGDKVEVGKKSVGIVTGESSVSRCQAPAASVNDADNQGFRPLSSLPRRSLSASSQENGKDKDKDKEKDYSKEGGVLIYEPMEIIKLKQGNEKMLLGKVYCHGENLFIQVETTAPPPRRRTFRKKVLRRKSGQSFSPSVQSPSSHQALGDSKERKGDENSYSSETSEMDSQTAIPTWLKEELALSTADVNDGNEADDTSGQSEEDRRTGGIDSSMSSIQINRALTPVAADINYSPRAGEQVFISGDIRSPRNKRYVSQRSRTDSLNSSESNTDQLHPEMLTDSSSGEATKGTINKGLSTLPPKKSRALSAKTKVPVQKSVPKPKTNGKGRGRGQPLFFREHRGFVSDVTVKRREETLLFELERTKQEKKQADARIRLLEKEREIQQTQLRLDAQNLAKEREKMLVSEVEKLRKEIQAQNFLLEDRQRVVGELETKLQLILAEQRSLGSSGLPQTPRSPGGGDDSASSNQPTPRAGSSSSAGSKKSASKICSLQ